MKNAIIIHGMPSKEEYFVASGDSESNCHWLPWLQKQLVIKEILAQTPEMPEPYEPTYDSWCSLLNQFEISEDTILIGHSCGGGFILRWLSENKINVGQVVLVAPWTDPTEELSTGMFDFTIDPDLISRTTSLTVFYSLDDDKVILKTIEIIESTLPQAVFKEFSNKGHFTFGDLGTKEFPELLTVLGF